METLDCRGLACPLPVMRVRDAIAARPGEALAVLVDNRAAVENVTRFVEKAGGAVTTSPEGGDFRMQVVPAGTVSAPRADPSQGPGVVVLAARERLGDGDPALGELLMKSFFHTLLESPVRPSAVICINAGVRLSTTPGQVADDLLALQAQGVAVLSCGTCLAHYGLRERLLAGKVSNMYEILETLAGASTVIPL